MKKVKIAILALAVLVAALPAIAVFKPAEGLTPGFWKNHTDAWVDYSPGDSIDLVFTGVDSSLSGDSLLDALKYKGGKGVVGAQRILLRAAVAALLNAADPEINYPYAAVEIVDAVNAALAGGDRDAILSLKDEFDGYNNLGLDD